MVQAHCSSKLRVMVDVSETPAKIATNKVIVFESDVALLRGDWLEINSAV
jgi:hypothetical protein